MPPALSALPSSGPNSCCLTQPQASPTALRTGAVQFHRSAPKACTRAHTPPANCCSHSTAGAPYPDHRLLKKSPTGCRKVVSRSQAAPATSVTKSFSWPTAASSGWQSPEASAATISPARDTSPVNSSSIPASVPLGSIALSAPAMPSKASATRSRSHCIGPWRMIGISSGATRSTSAIATSPTAPVAASATAPPASSAASPTPDTAPPTVSSRARQVVAPVGLHRLHAAAASPSAACAVCTRCALASASRSAASPPAATRRAPPSATLGCTPAPWRRCCSTCVSSCASRPRPRCDCGS